MLLQRRKYTRELAALSRWKIRFRAFPLELGSRFKYIMLCVTWNGAHGIVNEVKAMGAFARQGQYSPHGSGVNGGYSGMKHVAMISKKPCMASTTGTVDVETKITFIVNVLNAFKPLLQAKEDALTPAS